MVPSGRLVGSSTSSEWAPRLVVDAQDVQLVGFPPVEDAERWDGPASDFDARAERGQRTVEAAFGEQIDDLEDAID